MSAAAASPFDELGPAMPSIKLPEAGNPRIFSIDTTGYPVQCYSLEEYVHSSFVTYSHRANHL